MEMTQDEYSKEKDDLLQQYNADLKRKKKTSKKKVSKKKAYKKKVSKKKTSKKKNSKKKVSKKKRRSKNKKRSKKKRSGNMFAPLNSLSEMNVTTGYQWEHYPGKK
tara:strand:- start:97 stop:414 length:318 start_codon:yes stop_codon:yes gene_type:complete